MFARYPFLALLSAWLLLAPWTTQAQTPQMVPPWQMLTGAVASSEGNCIIGPLATDAAGNVFVGGSFSGTITVGTTTLTAPPVYGSISDAFVAKWDRARGNFSWVKHLTGGSFETINGLVVDGNIVYVAASFGEGLSAFDNTALPSGQGSGNFIAKITDQGATATVGWIELLMGGNSPATGGTQTIVGMAGSGDGLYITGFFSSKAITFGSITLPNASTEPGHLNIRRTDGFVAKLVDEEAKARYVWADRFGGLYEDRAVRMVVNGPLIYVASTFSTTTTYPGNTVLNTAPGYIDLVLAKWTDQGASARFDGLQQAGGTGDDTMIDLVSNGTSLYLLAQFSSQATFGGTSLGNAGSSILLLKLTDTGSPAVAWAQATKGSKLAVTGNNLYVVYPNRRSEAGDIMTKFTDTGSAAKLAWQAGVGARQFASAFDVVLSGTRVYAAGVTQAAVQFGPLTAPGTSEQAVGFLASLEDTPIPLATKGADQRAGVRLYPNPAHAATTVEVPAGTSHVTLVDAVGRIVRTHALRAGATTIELATRGLAPGLYHLRAHASNYTSTHALVVE